MLSLVTSLERWDIQSTISLTVCGLWTLQMASLTFLDTEEMAPWFLELLETACRLPLDLVTRQYIKIPPLQDSRLRLSSRVMSKWPLPWRLGSSQSSVPRRLHRPF